MLRSENSVAGLNWTLLPGPYRWQGDSPEGWILRGVLPGPPLPGANVRPPNWTDSWQPVV